MNASLNASSLLAIALAPLLGSLLTGIFGTALGGAWLGRRLSHALAISGVLLSFILSAQT